MSRKLRPLDGCHCHRLLLPMHCIFSVPLSVLNYVGLEYNLLSGDVAAGDRPPQPKLAHADD